MTSSLNTEASSFSNTIKTAYEKRLLINAFPRLVHGKWVAEPARISGFGKTEYRKFSTFSAVTTALTEGVTPGQQDAPTLTTVEIEPEWYGTWIRYTDKLELQAYDPVIGKVTELFGHQAGLSFDTLIRNTITAGATKVYSGDATARTELSASGDRITFQDILYALGTLQGADALPFSGGMSPLIIHPHTLMTLMQDSTFVALFTRDSANNYQTGKIGTIMNLEVYVSSNVYEYVDGGADSADVYSALIIGYEAFGVAGMSALMPDYNAGTGGPEDGPLTGQTISPVQIITKDLGQSGDDPLNQRGTIGWKATHADAIFNSAFIVDLEHTNVFS